MAVRPDDASDEQLLQSLGIGHLPCSLLLQGGEVLGRVVVGGDDADSVEEAAVAAARQLAALLQLTDSALPA